uniref:Uncharacterized protein n=1 Tax=Brassica campestris TaxID=3711 RepID=M4CEE4_BRACM
MMRGGAKCRQTTTEEDGMVSGAKSQRPHRGDDAPERVAFGLPSPVFFSGDMFPDVRASPPATVALSAPLAGL